jgi:hypothetical protein
VLLLAAEVGDVLPSSRVLSSRVPFTLFAVNAVCHQCVCRQGGFWILPSRWVSPWRQRQGLEVLGSSGCGGGKQGLEAAVRSGGGSKVWKWQQGLEAAAGCEKDLEVVVRSEGASKV